MKIKDIVCAYLGECLVIFKCEHCGNDSVYYGIYYPGSKYDTRPQISKEEAYNKLILWLQSESKIS